MNLYQFLLQNVYLSKVAVIVGNKTFTYGQLIACANAIARQLGVRKGERVALAAENSPFWIASYLAILKIGAVAVPIPARLSNEDVIKLCNLTNCVAVCIDNKRSSRLHDLSASFFKIIPESVLENALENSYTVTEIDILDAVSIDESNDLASLMFTSGSTGYPNAVKVTHGNIIANSISILDYLNLSSADRMLVVLPFDYCFGASLLHTHFRMGGSLVLNNSFIFADDVLDDIENYACTGFAGVPTTFQEIVRRGDITNRQLSTLRHVQQAGGKLAQPIIQEFTTAFPHVRFYVQYGQTEATARLSYLEPSKLWTREGSIGKGILNVNLYVLDTNGNLVKAGQTGELVAEGPNITKGYWISGDSKTNFRNGRLYTGDEAKINKDGYIYIVGRTSDFLKLNGHRISACEIEDVLYELPQVIEAAVIGVDDELGKEIAHAFLVTEPFGALSENNVIHHCRKRLPSYAIPRRLSFHTSLPKNDAGKIMKRLINLE